MKLTKLCNCLMSAQMWGSFNGYPAVVCLTCGGVVGTFPFAAE